MGCNTFILAPYKKNSIELLGFAKNDIVEARELAHKLPNVHIQKLLLAYQLLDDVQEYLYTH